MIPVSFYAINIKEASAYNPGFHQLVFNSALELLDRDYYIDITYYMENKEFNGSTVRELLLEGLVLADNFASDRDNDADNSLFFFTTDIYTEINEEVNDGDSDFLDKVLDTLPLTTTQKNYIRNNIDDYFDYAISYLESMSHFWDPYTLKGFEDLENAFELLDEDFSIFFTLSAPFLCEWLFHKALSLFDSGFHYNIEEDMHDAFILFGWALHIIQDMTVPYHCADNFDGAGIEFIPDTPQPHAAYERLCEEPFNVNPQRLNDIETYVPINVSSKEDWNGYCTIKGWVHQAALDTYRFRQDVVQNEPELSGYDRIVEGENTDVWEDVIRNQTEYCVSLTAGFIFYIWECIDTPSTNLYIKPTELGLRTYEDRDEDGLTTLEELLGTSVNLERLPVPYDSFTATYPTDYTTNDTDSDGMNDNYEYSHGTIPVWDDSSIDYDVDGLTNIEEYQYGTHPNNRDTDGEGLTDYEELFVCGTNPLSYDTDGDGWSDYLEYSVYHTDPNNPNSYPEVTPMEVRNFMGTSINSNTIRFTWERPLNWIEGWTFTIECVNLGTVIWSTTTTGTFYTLSNSITTSVRIYLIYCTNNNGTPGPYSAWVGKAGGGGGFFR